MLKPGALFVSYEWVATAQFDPNNEEHVRIIDEINFGNGLPVRTSLLLPASVLPAPFAGHFGCAHAARHAG